MDARRRSARRMRAGARRGRVRIQTPFAAVLRSPPSYRYPARLESASSGFRSEEDSQHAHPRSPSTASAVSAATSSARAARATRELEIVGVNDITDAETLAHLLRYDSVLGRFKGDTSRCRTAGLVVDGKEIRVLAERDPAKLPWGELGADVVLESTGFFADRRAPQAPRRRARRRSIISAPGEGSRRHDGARRQRRHLRPRGAPHHLQRVVHDELPRARSRVLLDEFGIETGFMTTTHAYTNDQEILDAPHSDLRRARSAAVSVIPTSTGAAQGHRARDPRAEGQAGRLRDARAGARRLGRRPVVQRSAARRRWTRSTRCCARRPTRAGSTASSRTPRTRSSRTTSSA